MTLYELLHKVSFDEIAPFLSKSYTEGRSLAWFKMHYDYLCHLVPSPKSETDDDIYVEMVPQTGYDTDESRITVSAWLDGNPWEDSLGREIIIKDFDNSRIAKTEAIIGQKVVVPNRAEISLADAYLSFPNHEEERHKRMFPIYSMRQSLLRISLPYLALPLFGL